MKIIKKMIFLVLITIVILSMFIVIKGYIMYKRALNKESLEEKISSIRKGENYTNIEEVPQMYINAVIAIEDHRFYIHNGIDIISIFRSAIKDIKAMEFIEGGSTITQQLSKNIYFTQEKKLSRKIAEVFMAFKIESNYEKKDILELYFNTSYYGDGYYSIKEACKGYFQKEIKDMTDYECILLAGIPNAPSIYSPTKNIELAIERQKQIMDKMIEYGYLTEQEKENIINIKFGQEIVY